LIRINNLTQKRKDIVVLDNINFEVEKNTVYGIIGDKDSGKSTLMEAIAGCMQITDGQILIDGIDIYLNPMAAKRMVGYMPEKMPFYDRMTVEEYMSFIAEIKGVAYDDIPAAVSKALAATDLGAMRRTLIFRMSAKGKARLGIAQALLGNPLVLLLDGPTAGLSGDDAADTFKLIKKISHSKTVIIASRDLNVASICHKTVTLSFGKLGFDGISYESEQSIEEENK